MGAPTSQDKRGGTLPGFPIRAEHELTNAATGAAAARSPSAGRNEMPGKGFLLTLVALASFAAGYAAATVLHVFDEDGMRRGVAEEYEARLDRYRQTAERRQKFLRSFMESRLWHAERMGIRLSQELAKKRAEIERLKEAAKTAKKVTNVNR
jgi:hypothetical protein